MPHLLIVEDSPLITDALRILFEAHEYRVSVANTVADGIATATTDPADVIVLDLSLPDGSGLDVLYALEQTGQPARAAIALTGSGDDVTRERCRAAGCRMLLEKPVPIRELLAQVQSL